MLVRPEIYVVVWPSIIALSTSVKDIPANKLVCVFQQVASTNPCRLMKGHETGLLCSEHSVYRSHYASNENCAPVAGGIGWNGFSKRILATCRFFSEVVRSRLGQTNLNRPINALEAVGFLECYSHSLVTYLPFQG